MLSTLQYPFFDMNPFYLRGRTTAVGDKIGHGEWYKNHGCCSNSGRLWYEFSCGRPDAFATTASRNQQLRRLLLDTGRRRGCYCCCCLWCENMLMMGLLLLIIRMRARYVCHSGPHWPNLTITTIDIAVVVVAIVITGWATRFPHGARVHANQAVPHDGRRWSQFSRLLCTSQRNIRLLLLPSPT